MNKILVIEDNKLIRETVLELLVSRGYEAVGAENGKVGIQLAIAQIPDLILSDVMMPYLNGFEVFAALRSHPATGNIPFIFMTASEMEQALEIPADGYLKKPCSITEILGAIANQLEKPKVTNPKHQKVQDNSGKENLSLRARNQKSRFEMPSLCSQSLAQ
ncbi:response regulator [Microcoleus sp. LEGE 07076]|uniref:response regulator transcription factor n=1 Tax=Microcoleus sp. LEGE 07076 TaxID=915322 RepID=UPI00187EFD74|nr:response regulator [Microcoleus sp. LEGE 07076]MBE9184039.1 response regulator [Microcoleus sp. LEGE 07076]